MSSDTTSKDSYESYLNGGKFPSSSLPTSRGMLPLCRCLPPKPMIIYIAMTLENRGRRFWRCRDWQKKQKTCNEMIWDDELEPANRVLVPCHSAVSNSREAESAPLNAHVIGEGNSAAVNAPANQNCKCGEILEKKKDKWKMKVLAEKKKVEWLKWILIASWLMFAIFFVKN